MEQISYGTSKRYYNKNKFFRRVKSPHKLKELIAILENPKANHWHRLYFVGFMQFAGYSKYEILECVHELSRWEDFDRRTTTKYIDWFFDNTSKSNAKQVKIEAVRSTAQRRQRRRSPSSLSHWESRYAQGTPLEELPLCMQIELKEWENGNAVEVGQGKDTNTKRR